MNGKNLLLLFIAITATVYLTGCTSDTDDGGGHGSRKTITFTLPASTKTVTYAVDTQQGEDDISHLDIYMFDKSTEKLEAIFFKDDINLVSNKATIDVTERTGGKIFYFIGNGNGITSELGQVRYGATTYKQFSEILCDVNT